MNTENKYLNIINKKRNKLNKQPLKIKEIKEFVKLANLNIIPSLIQKTILYKEFVNEFLYINKKTFIKMKDGSTVLNTEKSILTYLKWWYFYSQCDFRAHIDDKSLSVIPIDAVHFGFKELNNYLPFAHLQIIKLFYLKDILSVKKYRKFNLDNYQQIIK